jgi:hypothetical protein
VRFYLGTHEASWLARLTDVPLFVSHRRIAPRYVHRLPVATTDWALDSGGFTELSMFGAWRTPPAEYVRWVRRYRDEIGRLQWASPQDWMCEPFITAKTGLSVAEHQSRTVENYLRLRDLAPDLPFVPVLQGWDLDDYHRCIDLYEARGVDLGAEGTVGVGSVCRRQGQASIAVIFESLEARGLRLHGFGVKTEGLQLSARHLESADSMAWSYRARMAARDGDGFPGCTHSSCANCIRFAQRWRSRLLDSLAYEQTTLPMFEAVS